MAPSRKSSHESVLNCCETILQLYSVFVFRIAPLRIDQFVFTQCQPPNGSTAGLTHITSVNAARPSSSFVHG